MVQVGKWPCFWSHSWTWLFLLLHFHYLCNPQRCIIHDFQFLACRMKEAVERRDVWQITPFTYFAELGHPLLTIYRVYTLIDVEAMCRMSLSSSQHSCTEQHFCARPCTRCWDSTVNKTNSCFSWYLHSGGEANIHIKANKFIYYVIINDIEKHEVR